MNEKPHHQARVNPFTNRQPLKAAGREGFLRRVRESLGHPPENSPSPATPLPHLNEKLLRQVHKTEAGIVERWVSRARENSIVVQRVRAQGVVAAIDAAFEGHKVAKVLLNARQFDGQVASHLASRGLEISQWTTPGCRVAAFHCDAAVTDARAGLADSGAVMVWSDEGFGRSSTLVVPVHVILLPVSRVMPDLVDGFEFLMRETVAAGLPSNVVVINGPSKTADIEMNLVTGVHGPKHVHVVLIDGQ
jgi:L-lactate dehydrogenase complex protein LldG